MGTPPWRGGGGGGHRASGLSLSHRNNCTCLRGSQENSLELLQELKTVNWDFQVTLSPSPYHPPHLYSWSEGSTEITAPEICVQVHQTPRQGRGVRSSEGKLGRTPTSQLPEGRGAVLTALGLLPPLASHVCLCLPLTCRALGLAAAYPSHAQGLSSYLF